MSILKVYSIDGKIVGEKEAPANWSSDPINPKALKETLLMYQARRRQGSAYTKGRSDVKASGSKPWKQKGTGRARSGSAASPLWPGGGICFGPKPRDFGFSVPKKVRRKATIHAMGVKLGEGKVSVLTGLSLDEPKTAKLAKILESLETKGSVLIVVKEQSSALKLSARNIPGVALCRACDLNAEEILRKEQILILEDAIAFLGGEDIKKTSSKKTEKVREDK
ncbi:MAG: 50S ribosomal protein L4 [Candidatus Theseobacter exili]|nr:50S ribosomal protein L4 [Candidatus Theseobacter exili]